MRVLSAVTLTLPRLMVKCGGWFLWGAAAACVLVSGLMFFASYRLFKGSDGDDSGDSGSER